MNARVGVGVFVLNSKGQFIMGKRQGSHGAGTWAFPGGHLEFNEELEDCAQREIKEETDLDLVKGQIQFITATNDIMEAENKHYITIFMAGRVTDDTQVPKRMEPEKCEEWRWVTLDELRELAEAQIAAESNGSLDSFEGKRMFIPLLNLFRQRGTTISSLLEAYMAGSQ